MRIFLAGGGTGGATAPVLAVAQALFSLDANAQFFLVASRGVEKKMLADLELPLTYLSIPAGKWRRYFSIMNFLDLFRTAAGFLKSIYLIRKYRPTAIFGAGSFVQVPLTYAGFVLCVPIVIHQPDLETLLSTRLVAPIARAVTVSFTTSGKNLPEFSGLFKKIAKSKIHVTGNPVRRDIFGGTKSEAKKIFGLNSDFPVVLVMGGSQGSARINELVVAAAPELVKYVQIIHVTGHSPRRARGFGHPHYHACEYLSENLKHAYAVADFVICRAGMSTITELAALKLPAIVIPLPRSAQEANARLLVFTGSAVVAQEEFLNPEFLVSLTRKILWQAEAVRLLKDNIGRLLPPNANKKIADIILKSHD